MHALQQAPAEPTAGPSAPQSDAGRQAYLMLRLAFTVAPIAFGIDKFFNLLTGPGYYDVALRDFGLLLAAATLTRLAFAYDRPGS